MVLRNTFNNLTTTKLQSEYSILFFLIKSSLKYSKVLIADFYKYLLYPDKILIMNNTANYILAIKILFMSFSYI